MYLIVIISLLLTFSHKLVEFIIRITPYKSLQKYTVIFWALIILIAAPFFGNNYIFMMPTHYED